MPTEIWNSPVAVDHLPFYGPVYFHLSAAFLRWLGVTLLSFRLVSLLGTVLFVAAAVTMAHRLAGVRDRWPWALALVVLTPEISQAMATGVMHILAIAFEMVALTLFVTGLPHASSRSTVHGTLAGVALAIAAMTTPRSYLFIAAFFATALVLPLAGYPFRGALRRQSAAAAVGLCVPFLVWIRASHGDPISWVHYMAFIFTHEDTDVAILPTAMREWRFGWSLAVTPLVALAGGLAAARGVGRERRPFAQAPGPAFALLTTLITFTLTVIVLNYTFTNSDYIALPLFAVVVAMPSRVFGVSDRTLAMVTVAVLATEGGLFALREVRTLATWNAGDPTPLNAFVRTHVPAGSDVVGPQAPYFFPVERSGSRFRTVAAESWADWARWVPVIDPGAVRHAARLPQVPPVGRFFIWPTDREIPEEYQCVEGHVAGTFQPAPNYLYLLGPLGHPFDQGYPATTLYRLPPGCPTGYDPTVGH